ncbi:phage shock protein E [Candidatus Hakubella thermalkaliphila]|uniref:Phage shock protein E n=1 Tax=Candidatus Hakubella thermalkaliphila TaxID=2754717 RepID=A0A6V8PB61_9ACTN|nr:rhodanese-like domain-containing protein [Candidatus Hakubella thermalkaliphila]GFP19620.1 phage shock protein E [Candidatus Hakubella thermalkaliphila]GFP23060.1 hypothetical protein HKBW3S09_00527 [Candidatus Hakubella thermalkaliphila]GFP29925.1 phage shock protein E [Candidatus Hakubella thermalkaliphila]GFP36341.1 phage shock protein E [Candidatus Hakubella thermalkaliphila]GFP39564.1 phage shock protein E [Candidatus Hakubella thermalkaliphila]
MVKVKNLRIVTLLLLIASFVLVSGCVQRQYDISRSETPAPLFKNIAPREAHALMQDNQDNPGFIIIDVRTPQEFGAGYIEGAVNIDYYSETFKDQLDRLDKNKVYLVYCRTGRRSGIALGMAKDLGFKEVYNLSGGIVEWEAEGLPIADSGN